MAKSELVVTDRRLTFSGEGSTGASIQASPKKAEALLDVRTNALRPDSVFVPMGDRVAVKRISEAELSAGGIHIPDARKDPPAFGVVVGVGQGRYNLVGTLIPVRVQVGAVIMFGKYAGTDVPLFGLGKDTSILSLREEEVMGVIMSAEEAERLAATSDPEIVPVKNDRSA